MRKPFHPSIAPELTARSASALASLGRRMWSGKTTLILGAGVSASAGLPTWNELLRRIVATYLTHWEFDSSSPTRTRLDNPPKNLSVVFWEEGHWPVEIQNLASELSKNEDALQLAQMVKSQVREGDWQYLVRKSLYGTRKVLPTSNLLQAIGRLCAEAPSQIGVVTHNYDDTVEHALKNAGVKFSSLWRPQCKYRAGTVPLHYPHGYLKFGGGPMCQVVLAEDDYYEYSTNQYAWRNMVQLNALLNSTCVFIGSSLTDPQIRRLIWVAKRTTRKKHFALLPAAKLDDGKGRMLDSLVDSRLRELDVVVIRYSDDNAHEILPTLIDRLARSRSEPHTLTSSLGIDAENSR